MKRLKGGMNKITTAKLLHTVHSDSGKQLQTMNNNINISSNNNHDDDDNNI